MTLAAVDAEAFCPSRLVKRFQGGAGLTHGVAE